MVQQVTDHYLEAISRLTEKPAVIGHSFGGLISLKIAGEGASFATVSIDNAPFKGVLPLPISALKSAAPVLGNPANHGKAISLTFEQFQFGWTNNLDDDEAKQLYETYHVPASGAPLFQAAVANFNPFGGETKVNTENPDRGPVLIIAGDNDNTAPDRHHPRDPQVPGQAQRRRHRGRRRPRPRAFTDHRPRLAGGRRHRPGLRQAVQLTTSASNPSALERSSSGPEALHQTSLKYPEVDMKRPVPSRAPLPRPPRRARHPDARTRAHPVRC